MTLSVFCCALEFVHISPHACVHVGVCFLGAIGGAVWYIVTAHPTAYWLAEHLNAMLGCEQGTQKTVIVPLHWAYIGLGSSTQINGHGLNDPLVSIQSSGWGWRKGPLYPFYSLTVIFLPVWFSGLDGQKYKYLQVK